MDIKQIIKDALLNKGCVIEETESTGIITVYDIEGAMWDFTIPLKLKITPQQYQFLSDLRRSGKTNMFDAGKYLVEEYGIELEYSQELVKEWMNKFTAEDY